MTFDLFPTFATLAGINADAATLDGSDLSETLFAGENFPKRSLFWRIGSSKAARKGSWKLCVRGDRPSELYDLATDIGELNNLASTRPMVLSDLKDALAEWELNVDR